MELARSPEFLFSVHPRRSWRFLDVCELSSSGEVLFSNSREVASQSFVDELHWLENDINEATSSASALRDLREK